MPPTNRVPMGPDNRLQPIREGPFWQSYDRRRYAILFFALLLTLVVLPAAATLGLPTLVFRILVGGCLIVAVMPNATKRTRLVLLGAVLALMALGQASENGFLPVSPAIMMLLVGTVGIAAAAGCLRFTMTQRSIGSETIYAALSTYLLAGLFFGQIYSSLEAIRPGSIVGPDPLTDTRAVYYSFVTLATLGYGDYLPRTDLARGVATFEVIGGQLFLAVLVARLIGAIGETKPGR